jgi:cysteine dioxygenase
MRTFLTKDEAPGQPVRAGVAGAAPRLDLRGLLDALDTHDGPVPLDVLLGYLRATSVSRAELQEFLRFAADHYTRNPVRVRSAYEVLVLCWSSGQRSPIHDHHGSSCAVRVVEGAATEVRYTRDDGGVLCPAAPQRMTRGAVTGSADADMHAVANLEPPGTDLITLHIYSPPLRDMRVFEAPVVQREPD